MECFPFYTRLSFDSGWFARSQTDPLGTELKGAGRLGDPFEYVVLFHDLGIFKSGSAHGADQLCLRQASGDSAGPQRDIIQRFLRHRFCYQNITDIQTPAGLEYACPFAQCIQLIQR